MIRALLGIAMGWSLWCTEVNKGNADREQQAVELAQSERDECVDRYEALVAPASMAAIPPF